MNNFAEDVLMYVATILFVIVLFLLAPVFYLVAWVKRSFKSQESKL